MQRGPGLSFKRLERSQAAPSYSRSVSAAVQRVVILVLQQEVILILSLHSTQGEFFADSVASSLRRQIKRTCFADVEAREPAGVLARDISPHFQRSLFGRRSFRLKPFILSQGRTCRVSYRRFCELTSAE